VLYRDADGVPFEGPSCSTRDCAIDTVKPLDGTTVLGLVELDEVPGTALSFWKRHRAQRYSNRTTTIHRGPMDSITINAQRVTIHHSHYIAEANSAPLTTLEQVSAPASAMQPRFTKIRADGSHVPFGQACDDHVAVIDNTTGLMFAAESLGDPDSPDEGMSQEACERRCRDLRLLGFEDWILATRSEAVTLIDDSRHDPAIDTDAFPRIKPKWHWTSTPAAWSSASAWYVLFGLGVVNYGRRDVSGFALAVRRAGQ
jgi:hypothetical protein